MSTVQSINRMALALAIGVATCLSNGPSPAAAQDRPDTAASEAPNQTGAGASTKSDSAVLDLMPADAALVIAVPDLQRLKARGDRLYDETKAQGLRVSEMFSTLYDYLDVKGIIEEARPAAAMIANLHDVGVNEADPSNLMQAIVIRLPVKDVPEMAKRFKLDEDAVATGRIVSRSAPNGWWSNYVCFKDGYLLFASSKKALESVLDGKPISAEFAGARRKAATEADIVVLAGTHPWANAWQSFVERIESKEYALGPSPQHDQLKEFLKKTVADTRFVLLTATLDDGIHLRLAARFNMGGTAEAALAEIRGESAAATDLVGLPNGLLLGALSAKGDELRTIATARLLAPLALEAVAHTELLKENDPTRMLGTFDAVRQQLTGARMALYATGAATQNELSDRGSMAGVFVLESPEPRRVIEMLATDGIVLGGAPRGEENSKPASRIALRRLANRETIAGHTVDHLEIDSASLNADTAAALREAFGPAWMIMRAAPLDNKVVMLLGSERRLLEETLQGAGADSSGLAESVPFSESRARLDEAHQAAFYVSLQRILPVAAGFDDTVAAMRRDVERVSSAALTIERNLLQIEFWLPLTEIKAIPQEWQRFW